jgi:hypothetical protein
MFIALIFILLQIVSGQNLIVNGGFEDNASLNPQCILTWCNTNDTRLITPWILTGPFNAWNMSGLSLKTTEGTISMNLNRVGFNIGQKIHRLSLQLRKLHFNSILIHVSCKFQRVDLSKLVDHQRKRV